MLRQFTRLSNQNRLLKIPGARWVSNADMFEAFAGGNGQKTGKTGKTDKTNTTDPVININTDNTSKQQQGESTTSKLTSLFDASLNDACPVARDENGTNWAESFNGLGGGAFSKESQEVLTAPLVENDIEITPDGLLYLPEIKYRRVLNKAFGVGAWGLAPRSETLVQKHGITGLLTREYGMVVLGRLVSIARGEQTFFNEKGIPTATEGCKSNALMRCCKDLGIASELWDPRFIKTFKKKFCENIFVEYVPTKKKKKIWKRKDEDVEYPFKR